MTKHKLSLDVIEKEMKRIEAKVPCGECTACCLAYGVNELNKGYFEPCPHCIEKKGCGIYEDRPYSCKAWSCAWKFNEIGLRGEGYRPDKLGLLFSTEPQTGLEVIETRPNAFHENKDRLDWLMDRIRRKVKGMIPEMTTFHPFGVIVKIGGMSQGHSRGNRQFCYDDTVNPDDFMWLIE